MKQLTDYIYVQSMVPLEVCAQVIDDLTAKEWEPHYWHNMEGKFVDQNADPDTINDYEIEKLLIPYINQALNNYLEQVKPHANEVQGTWVKTFCHLKFNRYSETADLKPHFDHITDLFGGNAGIPVLSVVGLLNDDFEGGEFRFFQEHEVALKAGDIIIFPSCFPYVHEVMPITKGYRHSYIVWAW